MEVKDLDATVRGVEGFGSINRRKHLFYPLTNTSQLFGVTFCETLKIYNLNMQMCKPSCKRNTESDMISMSDGNQD